MPFIVDQMEVDSLQKLPTFEERNHFITIGNMLHAPNVDSVLYLKKKVWPEIKKQIPKAEIHILWCLCSSTNFRNARS